MKRDILRKGTESRQQLDRLQAEIVATGGAMKSLQFSLVPYEETRERLLALIRSRSMGGLIEGQFFGLQERNPDPRIGSMVREMEDTSGDLFLLMPPMSLFDLAWIEGPEVLVDKIMTRIKANGRPVGLPIAKHTAEMARLQAKLDELEEGEEIEVLRLEAAGHVILRRENVRPDLLVRIWGEQDTERAAA